MAYAVIAAGGQPGAAPDWLLGLSCGLGGLVGGALGAALQPHVPQRALRILLGLLAVLVSLGYVVDAVRT